MSLREKGRRSLLTPIPKATLETPPPRSRTSTTTITPTHSSPPPTPGSSARLGTRIASTATAAEGGARKDIDEGENRQMKDETNVKELVVANLDWKNGGDADITEDTPSPPRVILDLIDATCHEIIRLGGYKMNPSGDDNDVEEFIMPSFTSYANLAQRLRYYMGLLKQGYPYGEQQQQQQQQHIVLEKGTDTWFRLVMAKLILDICSKQAYPQDHENVIVDGQEQTPQPSLMDMSPSRWSKLRWAFTELRDALRGRDAQAPLLTGKKWKGAASLICVMEGFEALATLRKRLRGIFQILEVNRDDDEINNMQSKHLPLVANYVGNYKATSARIDSTLQKEGSRDYFTHLFLPTACLPTYSDELSDPPDLRSVKLKVLMGSMFTFGMYIDRALVHQKFPVHQFKFVLLTTFKDWEASYLPTPVLFNVGRYFKFNGEEESSSSIVSPPQVESNKVFTPEKLVEMKETSRPAASSRSEKKSRVKTEGTRAKRIPYTVAEKECLLKGVKKFGVGRWADILDHYQEVFGANQRSNINLKDLYRTLTKKNKSNND